MMKKETLRGLTAVAASLLTISVTGTNIALTYAGTINSMLGVTTSEITGADPDADTEYYKSEYGELSDENLEKLIADTYAQSVSEQEEGSVLLKNENDALPLDPSSSVTLFGRASADPVYKPTSGGASIDEDYLITYRGALESVGFSINEPLFEAYENSDTERVKETVSAGGAYEDSTGADIGEEDISFYTNELRASWEDDYNDVALVMLAREGGEDADLVTEDSEGISQLALHQSEKDLLEMIQESGKFEKTVVIINSPWVMETGWLSEYDIDACLWIGSPGLRGFEGVANILTGAANPSGKLVDIYATDSLSAPAVTYAADNTPLYANADEIVEYCSDDEQYLTSYVIYAEGIYVGYKYYETRYEDAILNRNNADSTTGSSFGSSWNYAEEVCYPFGFGLSYTTFEQTLEDVIYEDGEYKALVTVTNTGDTAGKSVVELYAQKPYGQYERDNLVEVSAVQIVGFGKTSMLEPGASEQVEVTVEEYLLTSYDYTNTEGYILSAGDYYLAIGDDSHDALNNILAAKGATGMVDHEGSLVDGDMEKVYHWEQGEIDTESYRYSEITGTEVTNQLETGDINYWLEDTITYLSRSDWEGTYPEEVIDLTATDEMIYELNGYFYETAADSLSIDDFTQEVENGLSFVDMKDVDYEDEEAWNMFLDQLSIQEMAEILTGDMDGFDAIDSVGLPALSEGDGIDGLGYSYKYGDQRGATLYTVKVVLSSTWNYDLVQRRGELMGEEALYCDVPTLWLGGGDIHRTAFSGRNFEYYSEDGYFGYLLASVELKALQEKGVVAAIKHFAGNDQEYKRESLSTFFNEQSFRENNLKVFEGAFCNAEVLGTMQGFNRIGVRYIGQYSPLLKSVLREEWGFKGKNITDAVANMSYKTHFVDTLYAGTDYYCWDNMAFGDGDLVTAKDMIYQHITENDDGDLLQDLRAANKNIYYALSRSLAINGLAEGATIVSVTPAWQYALYALIGVTGVLTVLGAVFYYQAGKKKSEED